MTASLIFNGFLEGIHSVCMDGSIKTKEEMHQKIQNIFDEAKGRALQRKNSEVIIEEMTLHFNDIDERLDTIIAQRDAFFKNGPSFNDSP